MCTSAAATLTSRTAAVALHSIKTTTDEVTLNKDSGKSGTSVATSVVSTASHEPGSCHCMAVTMCAG